MRRKLTVATANANSRAHKDVVAELRRFGCWTTSLCEIAVRQSLFAHCYGYQCYGGDGDIVIPKLSVSRFLDRLYGETYVSLRDVLRHEYAHAIAHCHNPLVSTQAFARTFGAPHDGEEVVPYCERSHVTVYAASHPREDFAEVFMYYLKHKGKLPRRWNDLPRIVKKWRYVESLCRKVKRLK